MDAPPPVPFVPQSSWPSDRLWFDPLVLNAATSFRTQDFTLIGTAKQKIMPASPRRWGLGVAGSTALATLGIAPWAQVDTLPLFGSGTSTVLPFLTLFSVGPLITCEWWIISSNNATVRVVELIRN